MFKNILVAVFAILSGFALISAGQEAKRISVKEHKFSITNPVDTVQSPSRLGIIEFDGNERSYGAGARYFLSSIKPLSMPIDAMEAYMKSMEGSDLFDNRLVSSMKFSFPDVRTVSKGFVYFHGWPAVQGIFSFTVRGVPMKGRYMIILVKEQSSIYSFTWSSNNRNFNKWNKAAEKATGSLEIDKAPGSEQVAIKDGNYRRR